MRRRRVPAGARGSAPRGMGGDAAGAIRRGATVCGGKKIRKSRRPRAPPPRPPRAAPAPAPRDPPLARAPAPPLTTTVPRPRDSTFGLLRSPSSEPLEELPHGVRGRQVAQPPPAGLQLLQRHARRPQLRHVEEVEDGALDVGRVRQGARRRASTSSAPKPRRRRAARPSRVTLLLGVREAGRSAPRRARPPCVPFAPPSASAGSREVVGLGGQNAVARGVLGGGGDDVRGALERGDRRRRHGVIAARRGRRRRRRPRTRVDAVDLERLAHGGVFHQVKPPARPPRSSRAPTCRLVGCSRGSSVAATARAARRRWSPT